MKSTIRFIAAAVLVLFVTSLCFAQEDTEKAPIEVEKKGLGYRYTYQEEPLKRLSDFFPIVESSPEATSQLKKARTNRILGGTFAFTGGFMVGWPIGQAAGGAEDPNWALAGVGAGLITVGIIFGVRSDKQVREGVTLYNDSIALRNDQSADLTIAFTLNGVDVSVKF